MLVGASAYFLDKEYLDFFDVKPYYGFEVEKVQEVFFRKEKRINQILDKLKSDIEKRKAEKDFTRDSLFVNSRVKNLHKEGLTVFIYRNDSLVFWSDNSLQISRLYSQSRLENQVVYFNNAFQVLKHRKFDNYIIVGLILIKHKYLYENKFLVNDFQEDFDLPISLQISLLDLSEQNKIYDEYNSYLFSLVPSFSAISEKPYYYINVFLYVVAMLLLLVFFNQLLRIFKRNKHTQRGIFLYILLLSILRVLMIYYRVPTIFYSSAQLFEPQFFGQSFLMSSLGDFLINSILILLFSYNFFAYFDVRSVQKFFLHKSRFRKGVAKWKVYVSSLLIIWFSIAFFLLIGVLIKSLILDSDISFEIYKVLSINILSIISLVIIALLFASFMLVTHRLFSIITPYLKIKSFGLLFLFSAVVYAALSYFLKWQIETYLMTFLFIIIPLTAIFQIKKQKYQYYTYIFVVFAISVFNMLYINNIANEKEKASRQVKIVNMSADRDPIAELLLKEFEEKVRQDPFVTEYLENPFQLADDDYGGLYKHLQKKYLNTFFSSYDLQISICTFSDTLWIDNENIYKHCYSFFEDITDSIGEKIPGTGFYFLDNQNGRISYLGILDFVSQIDSTESTVFVELDSKLLNDEQGYPELLLEKKFENLFLKEEYSYAKYKNNRIVSRSGNFPYNLNRETYPNTKVEQTFFDEGGYNHLIYNKGADTSFILSKKNISLFDRLISFSYIFVFFYLQFAIMMIIIKLPMKLRWRFDFKSRIQISMISLLLLSLLFVGGGTLYNNIEQFEMQHLETVREKTQSALVELEHKLIYEDELTTDWHTDSYENLEELLIKFSSVFFCDLNLYDHDGNLLASSRPEIFHKGLIGRQINTDAYRELIINESADFVHQEKIGQLNYTSAYVPFKNHKNKTLAYLNVPYFAKQTAFRNGILALVIAIINTYVILVLMAIVLAVFISNKLTEPLRMIQANIQEIELGKKSEQISYESNDEIGSLVKDYNRMMVELSQSAELLAKSERETAWREMARQIAHEIKNPLTPMRLTIQLLQRAFNDNAPNFAARLERAVQTIIEQIDRLSTIATGFSNFAKMPKANNKIFNLVDTVQASVRLFESSEIADLTMELNDNQQVMIFADPEQISQVLINLIKNSLQSIEIGKKGKINVELFISKQKVRVKVEDNGSGIPEEQRNKLFQPYFTTKSSGTGLGLSIVKSILENAGGSIWFETEVQQGTRFFIELPISELDTTA